MCDWGTETWFEDLAWEEKDTMNLVEAFLKHPDQEEVATRDLDWGEKSGSSKELIQTSL